MNHSTEAGPEEHATASRDGIDFPERWGTPRGAKFSDERRAWIAENIRRDSTDPEVRRARQATARRLSQDAEIAALQALVDTMRG